jgi:hypothetical protein
MNDCPSSEKHLEKALTARLIKGMIIEASLTIEARMDILIKAVYIKNIDENKEKISTFVQSISSSFIIEGNNVDESLQTILNNKEFTFFNKRKLLFKDLKIHKNGSLFNNKTKELHKQIIYIEDLRNAIAHRSTFINDSDGKSPWYVINFRTLEQDQIINLDNKFEKYLDNLVSIILFTFNHLISQTGVKYQNRSLNDFFVVSGLKYIKDLIDNPVKKEK